MYPMTTTEEGEGGETLNTNDDTTRMTDAEFRRIVRERITTLEERARSYDAQAKRVRKEVEALRASMTTTRTAAQSRRRKQRKTRGPDRRGMRITGREADTRVLDFLRTHPPALLHEVRKGADLPNTSAYNALIRLVGTGSARKRADGRWEYRPTRLHPGEGSPA